MKAHRTSVCAGAAGGTWPAARRTAPGPAGSAPSPAAPPPRTAPAPATPGYDISVQGGLDRLVSTQQYQASGTVYPHILLAHLLGATRMSWEETGGSKKAAHLRVQLTPGVRHHALHVAEHGLLLQRVLPAGRCKSNVRMQTKQTHLLFYNVVHTLQVPRQEAGVHTHHRMR